MNRLFTSFTTASILLLGNHAEADIDTFPGLTGEWYCAAGPDLFNPTLERSGSSAIEELSSNLLWRRNLTDGRAVFVATTKLTAVTENGLKYSVSLSLNGDQIAANGHGLGFAPNREKGWGFVQDGGERCLFIDVDHKNRTCGWSDIDRDSLESVFLPLLKSLMKMTLTGASYQPSTGLQIDMFECSRK